MINRFYSWPIRVHLTILIALLAVPSISLIVCSGIAERREAISGANNGKGTAIRVSWPLNESC
jgi:hypothetical protein